MKPATQIWKKVGLLSNRYQRLLSTTGSWRNQDSEAHVNTFAQDEEEKFSAIADKWWDLHGELRALHSLNDIRVPFIRDNLLTQGYGEGTRFSSKPLKGIDILDVGCGGGILCEPLARLGADVVGIDASEDAIEVAKKHRGPQLSNPQYLNALIEDVATAGSLKFDAVIASEVIEHVNDQSGFVQCCASLLKPRGSLIFSTINRTIMSYVLAVKAAEFIGVVPNGAHDWNKLVTTDELEQYLLSSGCTVRKIHGMSYNPLSSRWCFITDRNINYILHATRDIIS